MFNLAPIPLAIPWYTTSKGGKRFFYVRSTTFNFNYYKMIDKPQFCIAKIHATTIASSRFAKPLLAYVFVIWFSWTKKQVVNIKLINDSHELFDVLLFVLQGLKLETKEC